MNTATSPLAGFLLALLAPVVCAADGARIAIIIDDIGYRAALGQRALQLPGPVALAVLPGGPLSARLAEAAHAAGKDVLLHLPLQAIEASDAAEPGEIVLDMTREQFARAFTDNLAAVPRAVGVTTHRGSLLTQHPGHMAWLMEEIAAQGGLYFVDSYTTHRSVALRLAREEGIPAVRRDVFLDPDPSKETVEREFARLKRLAATRGAAVGIGHPYPATLDLLERELPALEEEGFELVSIGDYVLERAGNIEALPRVGMLQQLQPRRQP